MNTKKLLAVYGLRWNPFSPDLPSEGLFLTPRIEQFAWRVEQLVQEGGFALITGESGTGKSVALRIVAGRLAAPRDVSLGVIERPQSKSADFYGELGDLFAVKLQPHNRRGGFKALRERWKAHVASSRILVHHTRKNAAGGVAAGQGLRGSSDIHAFGDSNLYLRRSRDPLVLTSEHRAAPAAPPVTLELVTTDAATTHLEVVGDPGDSSTPLTHNGQWRSLEQRVLELLSPGAPVTRAKLRESLVVKNQRLGAVLESLERAGRLCRTPGGWQRREGSTDRAVPVPSPEMIGNGTVEPSSPESEARNDARR